MICASLYRPFFIQNLLKYLAEKIRFSNTTNFRRDYHIEACEKEGLIPHIPRPKRGSALANGRFGREMFRYDAKRDVYICPGNAELAPNRRGKLRNLERMGYSNAAACKDCPLRTRCTTGTARRIQRLENEDALDRMEARLAAKPELTWTCLTFVPPQVLV